MSGVTNTTPMNIFQNDMQQWSNRLNTAIHIFKEQMDMILEARNDIAICQHTIMQQNNQIVHLKIQMASTSTAVSTLMTTLSYSKKVEIFNDPGEYNRSKAKFEKWWAKIQAWLIVNFYAIPPSSADAIGAVLSQLKSPKAGPFIQVYLTQAAQGTYTWTQLVNGVEGLF